MIPYGSTISPFAGKTAAHAARKGRAAIDADRPRVASLLVGG